MSKIIAQRRFEAPPSRTCCTAFASSHAKGKVRSRRHCSGAIFRHIFMADIYGAADATARPARDAAPDRKLTEIDFLYISPRGQKCSRRTAAPIFLIVAIIYESEKLTCKNGRLAQHTQAGLILLFTD